ncbi:MAG: hypothetical protein ACLTDR_02625 [Adlercreutzia equolifaciens]
MAETLARAASADLFEIAPPIPTPPPTWIESIAQVAAPRK